MNNYAEITINGKKVGLTFGMIASEEFLRLQLSRKADDVSKGNNLLMICDAMYAGAYNEAMLSRVPSPEYRDIVIGVEDLFSSEDVKDIAELNKACEIWKESRFGKSLDKISDGLKKKEQEESNPQPTGAKLESSHMGS